MSYAGDTLVGGVTKVRVSCGICSHSSGELAKLEYGLGWIAPPCESN